LFWINKLYNPDINNGIIKGNVVVHHKDYNGLNNCPSNLEIMTFQEHSKLHGENDQCGEKNGMYGKHHSEDTKKLIGEKTIERCKDPEYIEKVSKSHKKWCDENSNLSERYGMKTCKGYGTALHRNGLKLWGGCDGHRTLFIRNWVPGGGGDGGGSGNITSKKSLDKCLIKL